MSEKATAELVKRQLSTSSSIDDAVAKLRGLDGSEKLVEAPGDGYLVSDLIVGLNALNAHGKGRDNIPSQHGLQTAAYELYNNQPTASTAEN